MKNHYSLLIMFILISLSCKTLSINQTTPDEIEAESTKATTPANEDNSSVISQSIDWLQFIDSGLLFVSATHMTQDSKNNVYFLMSAYGNDIALDTNYHQLFLIKISNNGDYDWQVPVAEIYFGQPASVMVDNEDNIFVSGSSGESWGTPIKSFVKSGELENDVFVAKYDRNGDLLWNTFLGNSGSTNISIDQENNVYLLKFDAFNTVKQSNYSLVKLDSNGNILFETKISELSSVFPYQLSLDSTKNIYISGQYYPEINNRDFFLAKLTNDGALLWNTVIGGQGNQSIFRVGAKPQIDKSGNVYVLGLSNESWGNPLNPYDGGHTVESPPDYEIGDEHFIAKLNSQGDIVWHTFINKDIMISNVLLDSDERNLFFIGHSYFNWGNPINDHYLNENADGFFASMDTKSGSVTWNTFIGGKGYDVIFDFSLINKNQIYTIGYTDQIFVKPLNQMSEDQLSGFYIAKIGFK